MAGSSEIKAARDARNLSQDAVFKAVGMTYPAFKKCEDGITIHSRIMPAIERFMEFGDPTPVTLHRPGSEFFGKRDLCFFSAAEGGPSEMIISSQPIYIVVRPLYFEHVPEGYVVLITGESMWPACRPGDYAIVNPLLPLMRDEEMIFRAVN